MAQMTLEVSVNEVMEDPRREPGGGVMNEVSLEPAGAHQHEEQALEASSLLANPLAEELQRDHGVDEDDESISFHVVIGGTRRGADLLVDSRGYTYAKRSCGAKHIIWVCSQRTMKCQASVTQVPGTNKYKSGPHEHIGHSADSTALLKNVARAMVRREAKLDPGSSCTMIVNRMLEGLQVEEKDFNIKKATFMKQASRVRAIKKEKPKLIKVGPGQGFEVLKGASKHNGDLLTDGKGHLYRKKRDSSTTCLWYCIHFTDRVNPCQTRIFQSLNPPKFTVKNPKHTHPPNRNEVFTVRARAWAKQEAVTDSTVPCSEIAKRLVQSEGGSKLKLENLQRSVSRARLKYRQTLQKRAALNESSVLASDHAGVASGSGEVDSAIASLPNVVTVTPLSSQNTFAHVIDVSPCKGGTAHTSMDNMGDGDISDFNDSDLVHSTPSGSQGRQDATFLSAGETVSCTVDYSEAPESLPPLPVLTEVQEKLWEQAQYCKVRAAKGVMEADWLGSLVKEGLVTNWALGMEPLPEGVLQNRHAMEGIARVRRELGFAVQRIVADAIRKQATADGARGDKMMKTIQQSIPNRKIFDAVRQHTSHIVSSESLKHDYDMAMDYAKISSYQQPLSAFENVTVLLNSTVVRSDEMEMGRAEIVTDTPHSGHMMHSSHMSSHMIKVNQSDLQIDDDGQESSSRHGSKSPEVPVEYHASSDHSYVTEN